MNGDLPRNERDPNENLAAYVNGVINTPGSAEEPEDQQERTQAAINATNFYIQYATGEIDFETAIKLNDANGYNASPQYIFTTMVSRGHLGYEYAKRIRESRDDISIDEKTLLELVSQGTAKRNKEQ